MYDRTNRYRCPIIRGKAQSAVEDLLNLYASIIDDNKGELKDTFYQNFKIELRKYLDITDKIPKSFD